MKRTSLTLMLAAVSTLAFAQKQSHISRSIDDDGNKLSISINGTVDGKSIHYDRTFLVAGLTREERKDITEEVFDSLGLGSITSPEPPATPEPAVHIRSTPRPVSLSEGYVTRRGETQSTETATGKPYTKEIKFDSQTGEMHLRYEFTRDGEEFVYEKTVDATSKSTRQREQIISNFEAEIVLPSGK